MRIVIVVLVVFLAACNSQTPTAPTPPMVDPPVVVAPPVETPNPLLTDPRLDRNFYAQFALGILDLQGRTAPLRRQTRPPLFYIQTVDNTGTPITPATLDATAAALINTTPLLNGGLGIEGLRMGVEPPPPPPCQFCAPTLGTEHHIAVVWDNTTDNGFCARSDIRGNLITVFLRARNCACLGLQIAPVVIKHELGHTLGFWHTDNPGEVMGTSGTITCDLNPSAREQFHATLAYSLPNGSGLP